MNIHNGHRKRLKDRLISSGLDSFQEHEVIELLLMFSIPQGDVNPLAHSLIASFGSLAGVLDAPYSELLQISGVGPHSAALIHLMPQLCRHYLASRSSEKILDCANTTGHLILPHFIGRNTETVFLICVDSKSMLLGIDLVHSGSINSAEISIRQIVKTALRYNAAGVVLAHNHPGGIAAPSAQDIATTKAIQAALAAVDVRVLDHIIVAGNDFISLAESSNLM